MPLAKAWRFATTKNASLQLFIELTKYYISRPIGTFQENNLNREAKQVISFINLTCFAHQNNLFCLPK